MGSPYASAFTSVASGFSAAICVVSRVCWQSTTSEFAQPGLVWPLNHRSRCWHSTIVSVVYEPENVSLSIVSRAGSHVPRTPSG